MNKTIRFLVLSAILLFSVNANADYIILNDGTIIKGKIESSDQTSAVIVKEGTTEKVTITSDKINKKITKPVLLEKLTIYKTDNTVLDAYCVDYDQSFYTFRKEINNPDEIIIPVKDVLFISSRLNPPNITFESAPGTVKLKWASANEKIKLYRIYYKKKTVTPYMLAGESDKNEYIIQNLEAGTDYEVIVRSVTEDGFESFPGKAASFTTVNLPPDKPGSVSKKDVPGSNNFILTWNRSKDRDGSVKGYNIYKKSGSGYVKAGTSDTTEYTGKKSSPAVIQKYQIKAVDDKGLESDGVESESFYIKYYEVKADIGYLIPSGDLADLFGSGFSGLLSFSVNNYFLYGLTFGLETGCYTFGSGKKFENYTYESFYAVPLLMNGGYKFVFIDSIVVEPSIGLGYCFAGIKYKGAEGENISSTEFTSIVKAGVSVSYVMGKMNAGAGVYYSDIIESEKQLGSIMISLSAGYMF